MAGLGRFETFAFDAEVCLTPRRPRRPWGSLRMHILQRAALIDAAEAIGVEGLHPHELRHTAPSLAIAAGANLIRT
jgi:integrase